MTLTVEMNNTLTGGVITPVWIVRLDIPTDPFYAWTGSAIFAPTGTGDTALDGYTFEPLDGLVGISDAVEDGGIGSALTMTAMADGLNEELLRQIVRDKRAWQGKPAWIWLALLNNDDATVIPNPVRYKTGVLTQMSLQDGQEGGVVSITVDVDTGAAAGRTMRVRDHNRLFSDDTFGNFVQKLENRPTGFKGSIGTGSEGRGGRYDFGQYNILG